MRGVGKPDGVRPLAQEGNPMCAVSPADCRLHVYNSVDDATTFWIKGKEFNLRALICDDKACAPFIGGSLCIARLAPQDYHRFHYPCDGVLTRDVVHLDGAYFTGALSQLFSLFCRRESTTALCFDGCLN